MSTASERTTGMAIGSLARRTGVPVDTLRAWERRYGVLRPTRTDGGQRRYGNEDVERVLWLAARVAEGQRISDAVAALQGMRRVLKPGGSLLFCEKTVVGARKPEIFPQCLTFVFGPEQVPALNFGNHPVDHVIQTLGKVGEHDRKPVAAAGFQPFFHFIGDAFGRADHGEA